MGWFVWLYSSKVSRLTHSLPSHRFKLLTSQVAHEVGVYRSFYSMKQLGVILLPPLDGMLGHRITTQRYVHQCPSIHLGGDTHCESKLSCLRTQHNVTGQGSNPQNLIWRRAH